MALRENSPTFAVPTERRLYRPACLFRSPRGSPSAPAPSLIASVLSGHAFLILCSENE